MRTFPLALAILFELVLTACSGSRSYAPSTTSETVASLERLSAAGSTSCAVTKTQDVNFGNASLAALNASDLWIAGLDGTDRPKILHEQAGASATYTPTNAQFDGAPAIDALSDSNVWVAGTQYAVGATVLHWDGSSWTEMPTPAGVTRAGSYLQVVASDTPSDVWFAGVTSVGQQQRLLVERWNGKTMQLIGIGPYAMSGGAADALVFSSSDVTMLANISLSGQIRAAAVSWDGSAFHYHVLPLPPGDTYSLGAALAASSASDVWAIANGQTPEIWHFDGTWQPFVFTATGSSPNFQGIVSLNARDVVIDGYTNSGSALTPLTMNYTYGDRWHTIANDLAQTPVGKIAHVVGTSSYWTLTTDGTGVITQADLVTCP